MVITLKNKYNEIYNLTTVPDDGLYNRYNYFQYHCIK